MPRLFLCCLLATAICCDSAQTDLPTETRVRAVEDLDRETAPPLYQYLYDSAFLPEVHEREQATRILLWLRYIDLTADQLAILRGLHARAGVLRQRLEQSQRRIVDQYEPQLVPVYDSIFALLAEGAPLDDPRFEQVAAELMERRTNRLRDDELLAIRLQSVRALLDEEQALLRTLTPAQEARLPDLVFALRRQLDPAATAGDFRVLVGTLYSVGDPTLLLRGDFAASRTHLDIGGLWADDDPELSGPVLHQARRELLLYLLLQEPALPVAIDAALALAPGGAPPGRPDATSPGATSLPEVQAEPHPMQPPPASTGQDAQVQRVGAVGPGREDP